MVHYFFYTIVATGISWLLYHFFFRKEKCFVFNRFFLLISLLLCLVAPLLEINPEQTAAQIPQIEVSELLRLPISQVETMELAATSSFEEERNILPVILTSVYVLITLIFLFRFANNLRKIVLEIRKNPGIKKGGFRLIPVIEKSNPFSFFHFLFLNKEDLEKGTLPESILQHEAAHSAQFHSADVLLLELLSCFFWINPFIWLYKKAVIRNHEYLADAAVVGAGVDVESYSYDLIKAGDKNEYLQLLSGFNFIQTRNRLMMIHLKKSPTTLLAMKIATAMILFAAVFLFSSFSTDPDIAPLQNLNGTEVHKTSTPENNIPSEGMEENIPGKNGSDQRQSVPYAVVEEAPVFPGCENLPDAEQKQCTSENIKSIVKENMSDKAIELYTLPAGHNVFVQFRINENGAVTGARARATSPHLDAEQKVLLEREAVQALNVIPQMAPAKHDGEVVGVLYALRL